MHRDLLRLERRVEDLALAISGVNADAAKNVKESDILRVSRYEGGSCVNYNAELTNGDSISADLFTSGPLAGQCSVSRVIYVNRGGFMYVNLPSAWYAVLEKRFSEQNNKRLDDSLFIVGDNRDNRTKE